MQNWSEIVTSYPENPEPKDYAKAIRSAEIILKEDLAPFEIEWLAQTLLFKPVGLFDTITSKRTNEDWLKAIGDSFKILSKLVEKCWDTVENYYSDIIELCMLPFDPQTRKESLLCLLSVARHPSAELSEDVVSRNISALEEAKTCKAPRALLIGTICRYHPELVQEHFTRIWRIYLNMLQPNNKTDQVVNSVLQGINGLFEHFGDDIEIAQINGFYDKMSRECIKISKCLDVLLSIFKHHARLFKERLATDRAVRLYLWQIDNNSAMDALSSIYAVVLPEVRNKEEIITSEVLPRLDSPSILMKHTALRILIQSGYQSMEVPTVCSGVELEFHLRSRSLSYEEANTVSWCINSSVSNNETMLLTAIMFYDNLPTSKKRDIVVNGILKASDDVRKAALILLIKLSLQDNLDKYIDVWRTLLDNTTGPDLGKAVIIFEDTLHHILEVLATICGDSEKVYDEIKPILSLMAVLLSLHKTEFNTDTWCQSFRPTVVHLAKQFGVDAGKIIGETCDSETMYVEKFEEDTVLNKLLSTLNTIQEISHDDTLSALQIIFSKEDNDFKVLSKALSKLQVLIESENNNLDDRLLSLLINQISKLKSKNVTESKDAKVFQKDATMFLGKYGYLTHKEGFSEDIYVLKLRNKVTLNVPNIVEGSNFKIDLQRVLQLCLLRGDKEALYSLLVILSASLCDRPDPGLQEATVRVIHAVLRCNIGKKETEISVYPALLMCNTTACVQVILKAITDELSPIVRRKLSDCLQVILTHEPGSEVTGELLKVVGEQAAFLMSRSESSTNVSGTEIIRAFLSAITDNNTLILDHLPNILTYTSNIQEGSEIFETSSNIFIEKVDLFTEVQVQEIAEKIIEKYSINSVTTESNLNKILTFVRRVMTIKNFEPTITVDITLNMLEKLTIYSPQFFNLVTLLAEINTVFNLASDLRQKVVMFKNGVILEQLLEIQFVDGEMNINAALVFLKEYGEELIEVDAEKTLQCLGNIIENIPPSSVLPLKNNLSDCLSTYKSHPNYGPTIQNHFKKWCKKLDLQNITECIEEKILFPEFSDNYSDIIHALKLMSDVLDIPIIGTKSWTELLVENLTELELKWGRIFLSNLLTVSEKTLSDKEFEEILENMSDFVKSYVGVYFKRLISKPFVLNGETSGLLVDVIEFFAKTYKEEDFQDVLDLVDHLWPSFLNHSTFDDKLSVLLNLLRLPKSVGLGCPAVGWAITLLTSEGTSQEDRIKLIGALPAGEEYSGYYRAFSSGLPVRLSEMHGRYAPRFRALLDSLANNGDMTLLDIVVTLAGGDDTKGWWDHAIDACMTALAAREDMAVFDKAYRRAKTGFNLGVCNRIFLSLLRHSSRKFCEKYICSIVTDLFGILRVGFKEPSNNDTYRKRVVSYAIAFNVLKVAFEKISTESLENGIINESAGSQKPWYFLEQTCKYCLTLSANVKCPSDASDELRGTCLWLQCSSYNCLTTAICRRKLNKSLSARIFNVHAWTNIVDKDAVYPFELQAHARYRGSKTAKRSVDTLATSSSFTGTVRSRLFLTTLSENPLQYDMIPEGEDDEEEEEEDTTIEFEDSVLNAHGCLTTLTALLEHASALEHTEWRSAVVTAVTSDVNVNVKWLLAQAICNAVDELKPHASALCPALLQLIAKTPSTYNGKPVLNNLHVDIISTMIKWNITDLSYDTHMNTVIEYLINTCIEYKHNIGVHKRILNTINGLLQLYGSMVTVKWGVFRDYCTDLPKDLIPLLPIFERLLKNGVALPELLTAIFANSDAKHWLGNSKLAEVCGLAFSLADPGTRDGYLAKFCQILNAVRSMSVNSYVKMVFYAQKSCKQCCDGNQLKTITDLAPKVEKAKCLTIISTYLENSTELEDYYTDMFQIISLSELFDSELRVEAMKIAKNSLKLMDGAMKSGILKGVEPNCRNSSVLVRREAFGVFLAAFKALVKRENQNRFKRKALDSSLILDTIDSQSDDEKLIVKKIFEGLFDLDEGVSKMMSEGLEECLSKDFNMRFAELFYIIVYQCSLTTNNYELSNCGSKLLELLFSDLRSQDSFQVIQLRDEGLPTSILRAYETATVRTKTMARTVLRSGVTYRLRVPKAPPKKEIDVQMPITNILDVFLQLSKTNSQVCQELCVQMMKCLQGAGRRFELDPVMAKLLSEIIKREPFCLTPLVLDACRIFIKDISGIQGFNQSVAELKRAVSNSEGYLYTNILFEDLMLRSGDRSQFIFSTFKEDTDAAMREEEFTLQGLINTFGSLSNWDDLRLQDKRRVEDSLPPLWTSNEAFTVSLREYFDGAHKKLDYDHWFNKMVASYYSEEVIQNRISWLKQTERWPKKDFVTSAIMEAIQWHQNEAKLFGNISSTDCLAEWAARLMIRSSYYNQQSDSESEEQISLSKDELLWCKHANEKMLPSLALQCIERNKECSLDVEILPWVQEKVKACRTIGLKENNLNSLQKALDAAEKQTIRFASQSSFETNVSMQKLILHLHHDLGSISKTKLNDTMQAVATHIVREKGRPISTNNAQVLKSFYETSMLYYDELWVDNDEKIQNDIILQMTEIIDKVLDHNLAKNYDLLISVLLNRLAFFDTTMSDDTAKSLLKQIQRLYHRLDFFSVAILKKVLAVLPGNELNDHLQNSDSEACMEYFQLICDANYSLLQYCSELRKNILDETEWNAIFNRMKTRLFETKHGGTDYQSLNTIKNRLYALEDMTEIDPKASELKKIIFELQSKTQRTTLRLSQLCPDLCSPAILERQKVHLQRLLRLPPNVYVVKFAEQISVFTDSVRRPCVALAWLSDGRARRYICKSGEPMFHDACAQRQANILGSIDHRLRVRSYNVTPLSEDSAIIEYLEDHVRLRDLMEEKHDINVANAITKAGYEKLILAPSLAMEQFNTVCEKVTPYILRSSIEHNCSCVKEFITKKRTFEDTLASMTIMNWLFGVGDRHLQNIMFSMRDGGVCGVDWASCFQYGCQELPPARLTANVLAVCDVKVLESKLQNILSCLRESQKLFEAFLRTSFYSSGPEFQELKHMKNILQGKTVSYEITRECIEESDKKYKIEYMKLLDKVFENFVPKDVYSVEEQVSCLLQHCTEPRILSVTPPGWEAWL